MVGMVMISKGIRWRMESNLDSTTNGKENASSDLGDFDVNRLQKLRVKGGKKTDTITKVSKVDPKKKTKKNRVWDESLPETKLDFTDHAGENGESNIDVVAADQGESMMDKEEILSSESEEDDDDMEMNSKPYAKKKGWFSSMFQGKG